MSPESERATMTPEQLIERVKSLGPEWNHAASKLEDAVRSMETAREHRVAFLERCLTETTQRLAALKEELRTLPEQIAKWEAERAHLEASTAVGLVMGEAAGRVKCDGDHAGPPCADRECWNRCERCRQTAHDGECGAVVYAAKPPGQVLVDGRLHAEVEKMADEAEKKPSAYQRYINAVSEKCDDRPKRSADQKQIPPLRGASE